MAELEATHALLGAVLDWAPAGILVVDDSGRIRLVNREVERLFGFSREELLGQPIEMLLPEHVRALHRDARMAFFTHPERRVMGVGRELSGVRADGSEFPVEVGLNPIRVEEGAFVLASVVDVSARREAEHQRRQFEEQLRHAQKMEAVGRLSSGIAHDFKNLLAGIIGCSNLAHRWAEAGSPLAELIGEIKNAADRGAALSRQLLEFGREQAKEPEPIRLNAVVRAAQRMLSRVIGEDIQLRVDLDAADDTVLVDQSHMDQILMNLLVNARDAMPAGGDLCVSTRSVEVTSARHVSGVTLLPGRYVAIEVADHGIGMNEATRQRVFEPFFTTKDVGKGTGLGLYTVYGIVRKFGGGIEILSELGEGTRVTVYIPCVDGSPVAAPAPPEFREDLRDSETVLLVEDDRLIRATLSVTLTQAGFHVLAASEPEQAVRIAATHSGRIDVLLTDIVMPGSNGVELARQLGAKRPEMRVIFMSAFSAEWLISQGRLAAGACVLEKPFEDETLMRALREVGGPATSISQSAT